MAVWEWKKVNKNSRTKGIERVRFLFSLVSHYRMRGFDNKKRMSEVWEIQQ
jgi:hypothetical protein